MAKKILVVDDEKALVEWISLRLRYNKYEVIAAYDAIEAVKLAKEQGPDLVLLDIVMPQNDGFWVLDKLKEFPSTKDIPVIIITAYPSEDRKNKAMEMGAKDFLTKPIDSNELIAKIKSILGE